MNMPSHLKCREGFIAALIAIAGVAYFHYIYSGFFPNPSQRSGIDFTYFLPRLLDGYFWAKVNGYFSIPWFTPSFCGGIPAYANPQNVYFSAPQALTFFIAPLDSVYVTALIFELLGFAGFYLLLRGPFGSGILASSMGAFLFMFNGFFIHRIITGHVTYHAFMLIPFICFFLLRGKGENGQRDMLKQALDITVAGLMFAYMVYSGMSSLGLPMLLTISIIGLFHGMIKGNGTGFWMRLAASGMVGLMISLSKLMAMLQFARLFPRNDYPMLGLDSPYKVVWFLGQNLFFWPDYTMIKGVLLYAQGRYYSMDFQFYEFSASPGPLIIMTAGLVLMLRGGAFKARPSVSGKTIAQGAFLLILLAIPVFLAYNFKIPAIEAFLKKIPILGSHRHYTTWYVAYMPLIIIVSALVLENTHVKKAGLALAMVSIASMTLMTFFKDRTFYERQYYNHYPVSNSYKSAKEGKFIPEVRMIEKYGKVMRGWAANSAAPFGGDDKLIRNASQMLCYEPIFGYWREKFPLKELSPGPAMRLENGLFNLKNPSCFLFPMENGCQPGDHFTEGQKDLAENFRKYKPFSFAMPFRQRAANWTSAMALLASMAFLAVSGVSGVIRRIKYQGGE